METKTLMQMSLQILGMITPFLIFMLSNNKKEKSEFIKSITDIQECVHDLRLDVVKLKSEKIGRDEFDKLYYKIEESNEKLNKLLGFMEKGCNI